MLTIIWKMKDQGNAYHYGMASFITWFHLVPLYLYTVIVAPLVS